MNSVARAFKSLVCLHTRTPIRQLGAAMGVLLITTLPIFAQLNTGRISGAVTDQTGGAIAGATVTVTDVARGESRPLVTDGAGQYAAPNLNPGIYTVRAEFKGFKTIERQNIEVGVGGDVRVDLTLQPGEQTQTVTVTEAIPHREHDQCPDRRSSRKPAAHQLAHQWPQLPLDDIRCSGRAAAARRRDRVRVMSTAPQARRRINFMVDGLYDESWFTGRSIRRRQRGGRHDLDAPRRDPGSQPGRQSQGGIRLGSGASRSASG